jgi:hypothetical protein
MCYGLNKRNDMNSINKGRDAAINLLNNCGEELEQAKDALRSIASYMPN